ncbi:hypothetical protein EJ08DRAFT_630793 [Tothia fuscella]|uniref:EthD domain-containing protein n=1 Tax=Tothia fuscella TaxID=1048955 RepID=A0A9P4TZG4_9PEZI|nr:hypothetical protein EJ08DRAFT_630793 [Tothia fuscella]
MPSQYLFLVNSRPTTCDNKTWEKWYKEEHLPDLVNHKASTRAAFYREVFDVPDLYASNKAKNRRNYLAVYQTDFKDLLRSEEYKAIRTSSEILPGKTILENGEFDARNYELIHDFDPNSFGDTPAPYILYAELEPEDEKDLDIFYREEHFPLLAKVPGYRKGIRYRLGPETGMTVGKPTTFVALHELEKSHQMKDSKEMRAVTSTPWTLKTMSGVSFSSVRSYELVHSVGY